MWTGRAVEEAEARALTQTQVVDRVDLEGLLHDLVQAREIVDLRQLRSGLRGAVPGARRQEHPAMRECGHLQMQEEEEEGEGWKPHG